MKIYDLAGEFAALYEMADDPDMEPKMWLDTAEAVEGEFSLNAENYAFVVKQLLADAEAIKAEKDRLAKKQASLENKAKWLKKAIEDSMMITGKDKIKGNVLTISLQNNPAAVVMDEQYIENIPEEYLKYAEPTVDKAKLKEDLKAGKNLDGIAHLEQTRSLRIR